MTDPHGVVGPVSALSLLTCARTRTLLFTHRTFTLSPGGGQVLLVAVAMLVHWVSQAPVGTSMGTSAHVDCVRQSARGALPVFHSEPFCLGTCLPHT